MINSPNTSNTERQFFETHDTCRALGLLLRTRALYCIIGCYVMSNGKSGHCCLMNRRRNFTKRHGVIMIGVPALFLLIGTMVMQSSGGCVDLRMGFVADLIEDYVRWRNIKSLSIFCPHREEDEGQIDIHGAILLMKSIMANGVFVSIQSNPHSLKHLSNSKENHQAIVTFLCDEHSNITNNILDQASRHSMFGEFWSWLFIMTHPKYSTVNDKLKFANFGVDADIVIADENRACHLENQEEDLNATISDKIPPTKKYEEDTLSCFLFYQVYSLKNVNDSLVVEDLGAWDTINRSTNLKSFKSVEKRLNMKQFPIIFGTKNSSQKLLNTIDENVIEDDNDESNLIEILDYIVSFLNATAKLTAFSSLGFKNQNNKWTDLLGAVTQKEVDVALDAVIKTAERTEDMFFTHKIMKSIRNIYVKPKESNEIRDIFLAPFGSRLLLSVFVTFLILAAMAFVINLVTSKIIRNSAQQGFGISDSVMWCIAVLTMQGSQWSPRSCSGNFVVILSLIFALIIFNAYSAFITSILSVELTNINNLDDLLASDYRLGYIKNSQDDLYLQSMNDSSLQKIYLRGYLHTVDSVRSGFEKTVHGHYGFFVSGHIARKEFLNISNYKCRHYITEIPIRVTENTIAFPMAKSSPFRKLINLSILKMYENGIHKYIHALIVPEMPACDKPSVFRSAHLADLTTAFGIFCCGVLASFVVCLGECAYFERKRFFKCFQKTNTKRNANNK